MLDHCLYTALVLGAVFAGYVALEAAVSSAASLCERLVRRWRSRP